MLRAGAVVVVALAVLAAEPRAQQSSVFRAGNDTVSVFTTATSIEGGQLVTDLTKDDFEVFDNGRRQPITLFDNSIQPIRIVVMLDMSGSMTGNLSLLRRAPCRCSPGCCRPTRRASATSAIASTISPKFTNNQDDLIRALWLDLEPGGPTPLWAAVNTAMSVLRPLEGRRVVLVLTDGKDTGFRNGPFGAERAGGPTLTQVITRAQTEDFMIYAIGLSSRGGGGRWGPGTSVR